MNHSIENEQALIHDLNQLIVSLKDLGISTKNISDRWHTFEELYYHRMVLFSVICNANPDIAWKSKQHHDGTMFDENSFICGINTPDGQYTYHYKLNYWDNFKVPEMEYAPEYDGHLPEDIERLYSLNTSVKEVKNDKRKLTRSEVIDSVIRKQLEDNIEQVTLETVLKLANRNYHLIPNSELQHIYKMVFDAEVKIIN